FVRVSALRHERTKRVPERAKPSGVTPASIGPPAHEKPTGTCGCRMTVLSRRPSSLFVLAAFALACRGAPPAPNIAVTPSAPAPRSPTCPSLPDEDARDDVAPPPARPAASEVSLAVFVVPEPAGAPSRPRKRRPRVDLGRIGHLPGTSMAPIVVGSFARPVAEVDLG